MEYARPHGLPLEDHFGDIVRKAMRGTGFDERSLAARAGIDTALIAAWLRSDDAPAVDDAQARAVATALGLDPGRLADCAARAWYPPILETPNVLRHSQAPHPSNGYVFFLEGGKRAALVDPAGVPEHLLRILRDGAYHLQYILITHKHADHCDATADIARSFPHAQIVMHALDSPALGSLAASALPVRDGAQLPFGDDAHIRMVHTPGHTDGSSSYLFRSTLFSGDTLFAGSVGGTYGDASTYGDLLHGISAKLFTLPEHTVVMPGHGPPTTVGLERAHNPFFHDGGHPHHAGDI
ncbi:MAG: MBL fold metallo-hydrolase [Vulcanimicrobiaceae bacterium]